MSDVIMHDTKVINLFGGPGAGKSLIAAELFAKMKKLGYSVELVTEVAKDLVHEHRMDQLKESQDLISAQQNFRQSRLMGQYEYIITDSPLLLGIFYVPPGYFPSFKRLVIEKFQSYKNINVYLHREAKYDPQGRYHDEVAADEIGVDILSYLKYEGIPFVDMRTNEDATNTIIKMVDGCDSGCRPHTAGKYVTSHPRYYEFVDDLIMGKVRAALSQASFCLRELLPNDTDAKMTVKMIKDAQAALKGL